MRVLITNDDGIDAPGLAVLEEIAEGVGDEIWVVAPEQDQSGRGRAVSLGAPVRVSRRGERRFAIEGTPCDCILLAVREILEDGKPDLVLSGVNCGQNIAEDTGQSGTVGAAVTAMQMGVPAIALSQVYGYRGEQTIQWETSRRWGRGLVQDLLRMGWPEHSLLNINFPDHAHDRVRGVRATVQGRRDGLTVTSERRVDLRGRPYSWIGFRNMATDLVEGTDVHAVREGWISVTPLHIDMTETGVHAQMSRHFAMNGIGESLAR